MFPLSARACVCICVHVCAHMLQGAQQTRHKGERMQEEKIALYICVRVRVCASVCASVCSCGFSLLWLTTKIPYCSGLTDMAFSFSLLAFFPSFSSAPLYSNSKLSVGPEVCSRLILLTSFSTPLMALRFCAVSLRIFLSLCSGSYLIYTVCLNYKMQFPPRLNKRNTGLPFRNF